MKRIQFVASLAVIVSTFFIATSVLAADPAVGYAVPKLQVDIPGVNFDAPSLSDGQLNSNFLGAYVSGVYKYLIGFALTIAIVMIMVGGLQYVLGASSGDVKKGKKRMTDAVEGFVLLMFVFVILYTVNPETTLFKGLEITVVKAVFVSTEDTGGDVSALGLSSPASTGTNGVPYFSQRNFDEIYGNKCDGQPTIKTSGCGPTSAAMILSYYNVSTDPARVAAQFETDGYRICGSGTAYAAFSSSKIITGNGLIGENIAISDHDTILAHLRANEPILISVGKSRFTRGGHFMVLTGENDDGTLSLNDPNSGIQSVDPTELWGIIKFATYIHPKT